MFKRSLTAKITFLTGGLIVLSIVVFSTVFLLFANRDLRRDAVESARIFATFSAQNVYLNYAQSYTHPASGAFADFQKAIEELLANNPDAIRIQLVAINGRLLMDSEEAVTGKYIGPDRVIEDDELLSMVQMGTIQMREFSEPLRDGTEYQYVVPVTVVEGVNIFSTVYSFSFKSLNARLADLYGQLILVAVVLLIIGLVLPSLFITRAIRPLRQLKEVAIKIGAGDFDTPITVTGEDEVGTLADAFRKMSVDLKKSRDELVAKITELERVIKVTIDRELKMIELKKKIGQEGSENPPK